MHTSNNRVVICSSCFSRVKGTVLYGHNQSCVDSLIITVCLPITPTMTRVGSEKFDIAALLVTANDTRSSLQTWPDRSRSCVLGFTCTHGNCVHVCANMKNSLC